MYCRHRVLGKASRLYKNMKTNGCKPNAITNLALGCLKSGKAGQALKTLYLGTVTHWHLCRRVAVSGTRKCPTLV